MLRSPEDKSRCPCRAVKTGETTTTNVDIPSEQPGPGASAMSYIEEALEKAKSLAKQAKLNSDISQVCFAVPPSQIAASINYFLIYFNRASLSMYVTGFLGLVCLFVSRLFLHGLRELLELH